MDTNVMNNQLCKVCGEQAAGFHFGAFTCEGCKSFFGRTYNNLSSISDCKNNGECVINKKNRTSCKACRLRKCFFVGMSKSGSRYGRRSNWFKYQYLFPGQGGSTGGPASHSNWDEDNNNVKKDPPLWRLPPIPGMPLFGFTPPLTPFFLSRGLPLQVPPSLTPPLVPPPPSPAIQQHAPSHNPVDHLRSLGPVQDSPMDLRLKKSTPSPRRLSPPSTFSSSQGLQNMPHHRHSPPLQHPIAQSDKQGPLNMSCIKIE